MSDLHVPVARQTGLVIQEIPNEILVYDLEANKAFCLNQTAALVWKACNGENSIADIAKDLASELKAPIGEDFIWLALGQLEKDNLLEDFAVKELPAKKAGLSRREAIKKIGLASAIALPIVAALTVPQTALAATCAASVCSEIDGSGGCTPGTHCCRGNCQTTGVPCSPAC